MSEHRPLTRGQVNRNPGLREELDDIQNPFQPRHQIPLDNILENPVPQPLEQVEPLVPQGAEVIQQPIAPPLEIIPAPVAPNIEPHPPQGVILPQESQRPALLRMAHPNAVVPMRDIISVVPKYDGHNIPLADFLEGCDLAMSMADPAAEQTLLRSKLEGEVRKFTMGDDFRTLEELKQFLKEYYFSTKTVYQLQGELGNAIQKDDENVITYANKIKELSMRIIDTYRV